MPGSILTNAKSVALEPRNEVTQPKSLQVVQRKCFS